MNKCIAEKQGPAGIEPRTPERKVNTRTTERKVHVILPSALFVSSLPVALLSDAPRQR